jgi:hypothetical protein
MQATKNNIVVKGTIYQHNVLQGKKLVGGGYYKTITVEPV